MKTNYSGKTWIAAAAGVLTLLFSTNSYGQRDPLYAQYVTNPFVINPAYAGLNNNVSLGVNFRNQWAGMKGSPQTINGNGHAALKYRQMGGGFMFVKDQAGNTSMTEALAAYSYQISLSTHTQLSFGMQAGFASYKNDVERLNPYDTNDPLFSSNLNTVTPRVGFGVILKDDRFMAGISVPRMLKATVEEQGFSYAEYTQHMYATVAYSFTMSDKLVLRPSALMKIVKGAKPSLDFNASAIILQNYQVGVMTRNLNTYGVSLQALISKTFTVGYIFEVPTGKAADVQFLTHELAVGLRLTPLKFHEQGLY